MEYIALAQLLIRLLELILTYQQQQLTVMMGLPAEPAVNVVPTMRELQAALGQILDSMEGSDVGEETPEAY